MRTLSKIEYVAPFPIYDITVDDDHCFELENGVIAHNSKAVVSGGTGGIYSSNTIFIIGKAQEKEDNEIAGYKFTINIEKSRFVREKSKFPFIVTYEKGINIWSGLLDIALETGHVVKPKVGWYSRPSIEGDKSWRAKDTNSSTFWKPIFENTDFKEACHKRYALGEAALVSDEPEITNIDIDDLDDN